MTRILFVSSQSSCRNRIAGTVMKKLAKDLGMEERLQINLAAAGEISGVPLDISLQKLLEEQGIERPLETLPLLQNRDYDQYDLLIGMDRRDLREMYHTCGGDFSDKMSLLLDHTSHPGDVLELQEVTGLRRVLEQIREGCLGLLEQLQKL